MLRVTSHGPARWTVQALTLVVLGLAAALAYQQGYWYLSFLGGREAGHAPDAFLTSHWTYFSTTHVSPFPEVAPALLNRWRIAPIWILLVTALLCAVVAGLTRKLGHDRTRQAPKPTPPRRRVRSWRSHFGAVFGVVVWCAALGIALSTVANSVPPSTPSPTGVFSVATPAAGSAQQQWRGARVFFPPTMASDVDVTDNYFIFGVDVPRGQHPEFSLWLPHALGEDAAGYKGMAPNGTEALSGCGTFTIRGVKTVYGRLTRVRCVIDRRAMRPIGAVSAFLDPGYQPVVIRLGGYPRYAWSSGPKGGVERSAFAASDYPTGGARPLAVTHDVPISHLDVERLGIAGDEISGAGEGGPGAAINGFPESPFGKPPRIEPAIAVLSSGGSRDLVANNDMDARQVGQMLMFYGQNEPTQEWQALFEQVQQVSVQQVQTANTLALILLGTGPFGALIALGRRRGL